ncbi:MAG: alpha-L-fucosidase [Pseudopedobacter saltans]|uniref:alpha-L-fucosidase n=1 Tax=Pseudopedobacter saltans TaxID=151895 RepID=A0A2W5F8P6_9SPHI|nr:MAG: alpha-L-fucosidase [Pseudopedobacter saltans]
MKRYILFFVLFTMCTIVHGQVRKDSVPLQHGAHRVGRRTDVDMQKWRDYGLGQFIHLGLYAILRGEYNGMAYPGASEWIRSWNKLPNSVYDSLYKQFNPSKLDPDAWATMAKQMGVKYVTITTRHHDGFCLWPSKFSDYTITQSPYKKDIIGPLVKAYNKAGIDVYLYYSILDWHSKDWRYSLKTSEDTVAFNRFKVFVKNQLTELLTDYPTVKGFWFDGTWDKSWASAANAPFTDSLERYLKEIHPGLIAGGRYRVDETGHRHDDANGNLMGDYAQGWERKIPKDFEETKGRDWDCDMTFGENGWGYQKKWLGHWKTTNELLEMMAKSNALDGNFVLNFGPIPDGTLRKEEVKAAEEIGNWMKTNGSAIYGANYTGWEKEDWGYSTINNDSTKAYLIVFNVPVSNKIRVLTRKTQRIKRACFVAQQNRGLTISDLDYGYKEIAIPQKTYTSPFVIVLDIINTTAEKRQENKANM